jgi:hypothetical protein
LARELAKLGPGMVVVKLGALGALSLAGDAVDTAPAEPVAVVDPIGAGDAFVAGYLSEVVACRPEDDRLRMGNALGAAVCAVRGDWEGLPTRDELAAARTQERSCDDTAQSMPGSTGRRARRSGPRAGMPTSAGFTDLIGFPRSAELTQRYS